MPESNPLRSLQQEAGAEFFTLAPPVAEGQATASFELVQTFGAYEAEYAAIRKGVGLFHEPQRGILRFTGKDVKDFLHRMLTQDIGKLTGGSTRHAFQLNVKGRIMADLLVHHGAPESGGDTWLDGDAFDLPAVARLYNDRLFSEDVQMVDWSEQRTCLALHGPQAADLLGAVADDAEAAGHMFAMPGTHHVLRVAGRLLSAYRFDPCGVPGVRLWVRNEDVAEVYATLAHACGGLAPDIAADAATGGPKRQIRGRAIGWLAYNTARIEAGTPLFHVDFGPDSLPHEVGPAAISSAVSFNKGCYLGQEIVARMQNLGHPKKVLVGLRFEDDKLPIAGAQVLVPADADVRTAGQIIGSVTSSTISPLLGNIAIALGMLKWGQHQPDTKVSVPAEGKLVPAVVQQPGFL